MATRNWQILVAAVGCSWLALACGSSSDDPATPAAMAGSTSTAGGGSSAGGSSAGGTASGGAGASAGGAASGGAGAANGGGGSSAGGAGGGACTPLMPTGTAHQLIISEIVPEMGIEVFNPGTTAVPVNQIWFCSQFDYKQAPATSGKTEVAPGAFVALGWPEGLEGNNYGLATAAGGEMLMSVSPDPFPTENTTQSYVCWGNHVGGRKDDTTVGVDLLYTGDCAPALTGGAIVRKPSTNGMDATSYDTTVAPSLADCP